MTETTSMASYYRVLCEHTRWKERNLRFYAGQLFRDVEFKGKKMLDIGAGDGCFSLLAASRGADKVVALEPEAAGATDGVQDKFTRMRDKLGLNNVTLLAETLQGFDPAGEKFDIVFLHNSINHLDEPACMKLHQDAEAWAIYRGFFRQLFDLMSPGGILILADCSRYNLFPMLGLTHPLLRTIEWHKHQPPGRWARLAGEVGFINPRVTWKSLSPLGSLGQCFMSNRIASFFLLSHFTLHLKKPV